MPSWRSIPADSGPAVTRRPFAFAASVAEGLASGALMGGTPFDSDTSVPADDTPSITARTVSAGLIQSLSLDFMRPSQRCEFYQAEKCPSSLPDSSLLSLAR